MGMFKIVLYTYPESQLCEECRYSVRIYEDRWGPNAYQCLRNSTKNNGIDCKKMLPADPEEIYEP